MQHAICCALIVLVSFAGGFARAAERASPPAAETQADAYARQEAQLQATLRDNPDDRAALEKTALLAVERGQFREADRIYTRLLETLLPDPAAALPIMVCKWHLLQDYEAQAGVIRAENENKLTQGNQRLAAEWLAEIYNPESVTASIRDQILDPEYAPLLDNLERHWLESTARFRELETKGTVEELRAYARSLFGDSPAHSFFALWRGFALIHQKNLDKAEAALNVSALALADSRTRLDVAAGSSLIREFRRGPLSNELLNNLSSFISDVSSNIGGQLSETFVTLEERFDNAQKLIDERNFDAAAELLNARYPEVANDPVRRTRYVYLHAQALWGRQEFARANQGFTASAVLLRERYAISVAFQRMADYAAMKNKREQAAVYAVRSAALLRDQPWKLRETGEFFMRLNMPERAIAYFERSLDVSDTMAGDADAFASLAEAYRRIGEHERYLEYAKDYVDTIGQVEELGDEVTPNQDGLRHYYQAEIFLHEKKLADAYREYETASGIITEPYRLSDVLMAMANLKARAGETARAEELGIRVAELLPDQDWRLRDVGNLFLNLKEPEKALPYYEKALEYGHTLQGMAASYSCLADVHNRLGDLERAQHFARNYIILVKAHQDKLSDAEEGLAAFYQGEAYNYQGDPRRGYLEYERAVRLLEDPYRRADALMRMAEYQAAHGTREQMIALAEASEAEVPGEWWKLRQVGEFFLRQNMPDKAMKYFSDAAGLDPETGMTAAYAMMADAYKAMGDPEHYSRYMQDYINAVHEDGRVPSRSEEGLAAYFEGEIAAAAGDIDTAYAAYGKAAGLIDDRNRRYEILTKMAEYQAERGAPGEAAELVKQSECYVQMAEIEAGRENAEEAARLLEKAMATIPGNDWRVRQAAEMYDRLDMMPEAIELYQRVLAQAKTAKAKAAVCRSMAEAYKKTGDFDNFAETAERYIALVGTPDFSATPDEKAWAAFYRGELSARSKDYEQALAAYEESAGLFTDSYQKSEAYYRMAEVEAERGNDARAAELMEKSIFLVPDNSWRMHQAVEMFARLDRRDAAFRVLEEQLAKAGTPKEKAAAYADAAELHKRFSDSDGFLRFARQYVDVVADGGFVPTREETGRSHIYQAELFLADDDEDSALASLEKAVGFYDDKDRQAELYIRMAGLQADLGRNDEAARLAEQAVSLQPDSPWRIADAAGVFVRVQMREKALEYYNRRFALAKTPREKGEALSALADFHAGPDRDKYIQYAKDYIAVIAAPGYEASNDELGRMHYYRAEMYRLDDMGSEAIADYETAAGLVTDKYFQSSIFIKIAELEVARDNKAKALELAARSLAEFPNDVWKSVEAVRVYESAGQPEKAVEILRRLEGLDSSAKSRWLLYSNLAELYRKDGKQGMRRKYVAQYVDSIAQKRNATASDRALGHFYLAELQQDDGNQKGALELYHTALQLYDGELYRQSEIALKIAEIHAQMKDSEKAVEYAEKSAEYAKELPDRLRAAGDFLLSRKETNRAFRRFFEALRISRGERAKAASYETIAKAFKTIDDKERYFRYASEYYFAIDRLGGRATTYERANQAFYLGEMHMVREDEGQAYLAYERASQLYADPFMRTEALLPMARYNLKEKNREIAAEQANEVADLIPEQGWRVADAASILSGAGRNDLAIRVLQRAIDLNPMNNSSLYRELSSAYVNNKDKKAGIKASENYIDYLYEKSAGADPDSLMDTQQTLWNARENHANLLKPWGLGVESYQYLKRNENGSYSITTSHELQKYYYLNRRLRGKVFLNFSDTLFALNKGNREGGGGTWRSYQRAGESMVMGMGFSVEPFSEGILQYLNFNFEYLKGLGKNSDMEDWRIRPVFDMGHGDKIRPFGTRWHYTKIYSALVYSGRNEDLTSYGAIRKGYTFATGKERNLLIIPYGTVTYRYGGKNMKKGERWGSEIGGGISFKQYFRTGRYHLPRANIEFDFYYRFGLTKGMMNSVGLTIATNF